MQYEYFIVNKAVLPPASAFSTSTPLSASYKDFFYGSSFDGYISANLDSMLNIIDYYSLTQKIKDIFNYQSKDNSKGLVISLSGRYVVDNSGRFIENQTPSVIYTLNYR
ncbi:hypothetical protein EB118_16255 [bacterium]|nr:hypothetical protein [bacterium]